MKRFILTAEHVRKENPPFPAVCWNVTAVEFLLEREGFDLNKEIRSSRFLDQEAIIFEQNA